VYPSGEQERQGSKPATQSASMSIAMFRLHVGFLSIPRNKGVSLSMIGNRFMLATHCPGSQSDARRSEKPPPRAHHHENREVSMKRTMLGFAAAICLVTPGAAQSNDPQPTCKMCPGTYIPVDELQAYTKKAIAEKRVDQQVRDVDIGKAHIGIGMVYRGKLDAPAPESVAEHDLVSEVYHIIEGSGTLVLGPDIADMKRRPATSETVRLFNGPGNNGTTVRNGATYQLKAGDVVIIPAGTGHWFTKIDDHITYVMVRIDPDKVTPVRDEAASQAYLKTTK
jgi:mannose-6-phosphate isomerase-like protein (cupin superfamily)